jgi:hypothetical protein
MQAICRICRIRKIICKEYAIKYANKMQKYANKYAKNAIYAKKYAKKYTKKHAKKDAKKHAKCAKNTGISYTLFLQEYVEYAKNTQDKQNRGIKK